MFPKDMVCLGNISVDTLHKGGTGDNNNNNNNNNLIHITCIFYYFVLDQQMHSSFTNYHTPTCFDTIVSSSGSL
jgi:hypothetical protein